MDVAQFTPGSIVVGADGSTISDGAIDWAADQAALESRPLIVVHATAPVSPSTLAIYPAGDLEVTRLLDDAHAAAQLILTTAAARARDRQPGIEVHHVLSVADPRAVLLDLSEHAATIVLGSRGRGPIASLLLGSVSVSVSRHASCPVVVWRAHASARSDHQIVVGVDGRPHSIPAIEFACRMAALRGDSVTVLHCTWTAPPVTNVHDDAPPPDLSAERALVAESLAGMAELYPDVALEVRMVSGSVDHHLIAASRDHDLVVVGHRRMGHLRELIHDSVAPAVLEHAEGAVAVVPSLVAR
ncbi:MAG: universal stress protein [Ornithinibacter sp.]